MPTCLIIETVLQSNGSRLVRILPSLSSFVLVFNATRIIFIITEDVHFTSCNLAQPSLLAIIQCFA